MAFTNSKSRSDIIDSALRKSGILIAGGSATSSQLADAVEALNSLLLNINGANTIKWPISGVHYGILMEPGRGHYGLAPDVMWPEAVSIAQLYANSLANPELTSGTSWTVSGDFALATNVATYTDSAHSGTLNQAYGTMSIAPVADAWYLLWFKITASAGRPVVTISNNSAHMPISIPIANGTYGVVFQWKDATDNLTLSVTSIASDTFVIDNIYMHRLYTTEYPVYPISANEFSAMSAKVGSSDAALYYYLDEHKEIPEIYVTPIPSTTVFCLRYVGKKKIDLLDDATDTFVNVPTSYRRFIEWQLAADLAMEYGRPLEEIQYCQSVAVQALGVANQQQREFLSRFTPKQPGEPIPQG